MEEVVVRVGLHLNVRLEKKRSMHESHLLMIETIKPILNCNGHKLQLDFTNRDLERCSENRELGETGLEAETFILLKKACKISICIIHFTN